MPFPYICNKYYISILESIYKNKSSAMRSFDTFVLLNISELEQLQ